MESTRRNCGNNIGILKLSILAVSLLANVVMIACLVRQQISVRRSFGMMRVAAGEYSIGKIQERLGHPVRIFNPDEENLIFPYGRKGVRIPKISHSAWLYCAPELKCLVYVDKAGYVENVICR